MTISEQASVKASERNGGKPFESQRKYTNAVRRELKLMGYLRLFTPEQDEGGNCVICGEAGRCPKVHAEQERVKGVS